MLLTTLQAYTGGHDPNTAARDRRVARAQQRLLLPIPRYADYGAIMDVLYPIHADRITEDN